MAADDEQHAVSAVLLPEQARVVARVPRAQGELPEYRTHGLALIGDDEAMIRALTTEVLRLIGMTVISANDGEEAIARFREQEDAIDLVLLDMTMPRMGGSEALAEIRARSPNTPVILLSGFHEQENVRTDHATRFLAEPFEINALVACIRDSLRARRGG